MSPRLTLSAASYPPLQETQGRGTRRVASVGEVKGWATRRFLASARDICCLELGNVPSPNLLKSPRFRPSQFFFLLSDISACSIFSVSPGSSGRCLRYCKTKRADRGLLFESVAINRGASNDREITSRACRISLGLRALPPITLVNATAAASPSLFKSFSSQDV